MHELRRAKPLRPLTHEAGNRIGGQVWSITGATSTVRLKLGGSSKAFTVATSLLPAGAGVGVPVIATVDNVALGSGAFTILALEAGQFAPGQHPPEADLSVSVGRGEFRPAAWLAGSKYYDWAEADRRNAAAVERAWRE